MRELLTAELKKKKEKKRKPVFEAGVWTEALNGTDKHTREPSGQRYLLCEPDSDSFSRILIKVEGKSDSTKFSDLQTYSDLHMCVCTHRVTSNDSNEYKISPRC